MWVCGVTGDPQRAFGNCLSCLIAPGLPLLAPNPLFPACAGARPRVGGVLDRSVVDRGNTAAENPRGSGLPRNPASDDFGDNGLQNGFSAL